MVAQIHFLKSKSFVGKLFFANCTYFFGWGLNNYEKSGVDYIIEIDEATHGVSGSPPIPPTILDKIKVADMFVCDITTINTDATDVKKKTPNPNVVFELGYAVAHLGWNRIMLLFNKKLGTFPDDMPFDFDRHRASSFSAQEKPSTQEKQALNKLLESAINLVIQDNPERPTGEMSPEKIKYTRDVENLKWILSTLHLPTLQQHILNCPRMIEDKVFCYFFEDFRGVVKNQLFYLYDLELFELFHSLYQSFDETLQYDRYYHQSANAQVYIFSNSGDMPLNNGQQKAWDSIQSASNEMRIALDKILTIVRERFLEVDIISTNKIAWDKYIKFKKSMES